MAIVIRYGSVTPGAKEDFKPELVSCASISNADDLTQNISTFTNYGNPCERYSVLLGGKAFPIPEDTATVEIGVWSEDISGADGSFENVPIIALQAANTYSASGLTFQFDTDNNVYPTEVLVSWYKGDEYLHSVESGLSSAQEAVVFQDVENFDKIIVEFPKLNTPYSRLKLRAIEYGATYQLTGSAIKAIAINQSMNPISATVPVSAADITIINRSNTDYDFSEQQVLDVSVNDRDIGRYFISEAHRTTQQEWNIKGQDYIYLLDAIDFEGGVYANTAAGEIAKAIFDKANIAYEIDDDLAQITVSGYIPYTTCRKALQQLAFAIGGFINTAYTRLVQIKKIGTDVSEHIGLNGRVLQGSMTVESEADITEVELSAHAYTPNDTAETIYTASEDVEGVKIIFDEPIVADSLAITGGEILSNGTNFAIINCSQGGTLSARKYVHSTYSKSKKNTATHSRQSNKKSITSATLISATNVDSILNLCYNYLTKTKTLKAKIVEGQEPLMIGNTYAVETDMWGEFQGIMSEQRYSIYSSKLCKEVAIK